MARNSLGKLENALGAQAEENYILEQNFVVPTLQAQRTQLVEYATQALNKYMRLKGNIEDHYHAAAILPRSSASVLYSKIRELEADANIAHEIYTRLDDKCRKLAKKIKASKKLARQYWISATLNNIRKSMQNFCSRVTPQKA